MRQACPRDVSREQFKVIRPALEKARKVTRPREVDLYDIFCAVLYVLRECCWCRSLPHDFPKWQNVYKYFRMWSEVDDNEDRILNNVFKKMLQQNGRDTDANLAPR